MPKKPIYSQPASLLLLTMLILFVSASCDKSASRQAYEAHPNFLFEKKIAAHGGELTPTRLAVYRDTLYVAYAQRPRIDMFTPSLDLIGSISLTDPEPITPTSFAISDSNIFVSDHVKGVVVIYDRNGKYIDSFDRLPDEQTKLSPLDITYLGGILYVADIGLQRVLAISVTNARDVTEMGELVLEFPKDTTVQLQLPSAVWVTPDGRLLVGNATTGATMVFACEGGFMYEFEQLPSSETPTPMGYDMDRVVDPDMQDSSSFDPSFIDMQGRIHVADARNGRIQMFNPLGHGLGLWPDDDLLKRPADIAIHRKSRQIYIADSEARRIFVFEY